MAFSAVYFLYYANVHSIQRRELLLEDQRSIARELLTHVFDNSDCNLGSPTEDASPVAENTSKTHHILDQESISLEN